MHALHALFHTLATQPELTESGRVLFMRAQPHAGMDSMKGRLTCEQTWKPRTDALEAAGWQPVREAQGTFDTILLLPERQRDRILSDITHAAERLADGGTLVIALHNDWGARRVEQHLVAVAADSPVHTVSKNHCRVFWAVKTASWKTETLQSWRTAGALQRILGGQFWSLPGLFNWNEIDDGSRLLTEHLPRTLSGAVADLGCGWGYLSDHILRHCPNVRSLDAYEADGEALEAVRRNLGLIPTPIKARLHWRDVTTGLGNARFDVVVMNPPFHDGRDADHLLGIKFITAAAQALRSQGELWLVANKHLPYERALGELFGQVRLIQESRGFKVLHASLPNPSLQQRERRPRRR